MRAASPSTSLARAVLPALLAGVFASLSACRVRPLPPPPRDFAAPAPVAAPDARFAEPLRALASEDFATRARASETLVAAGEDALPALVAAGDAPVPVHGGRASASATRPVVEAIVAAATLDRLVAGHLASPGVAVRRAAAEEVGRRGAWSAVPALIERLADEDAGVRTAAAGALRRVTGRADVLPATACDASSEAARWRAWWEHEGRGLAPAALAAGPP